jgi:ribonuclease P protein component
VPLTSTVETFSRTSQHDGLVAGTTLAAVTLANATPADATLGTRFDFAMPPKPTARFPRSARLLRHADFERVYKQGRRHFSASITVFYLPRPEEGSPVTAASPSSGASSGLRIGFTVGRTLGGAVQRNRIKRRLREAVRMSRPPAGVAADVVINPKKSLLTTNFAALLIEVTRAFVVIEQKLSGKTYPETATNRLAESRNPKPGSRP